MSKKEKKFFRNCPKCGEQIGHTHHSNRDRAEAKGKTCRSCSMGKTHFRNCPRCDKPIGYTTAASRDYSEAKCSVCRGCINTIYKTGKPLSAETKAKQSSAKKIIIDACIHLYGNKIEYPRHYFRNWANDVKKRDNNTCKCCNTVGSGSFIHAHHVVPKAYFPETALEISNGVTLCAKCHKNLHMNLDRITLAGTKLTQVGFQDHCTKYIAEGQASSASTDVPTEYKPVFKPMITSHKE